MKKKTRILGRSYFELPPPSLEFVRRALKSDVISYNAVIDQCGQDWARVSCQSWRIIPTEVGQNPTNPTIPVGYPARWVRTFRSLDTSLQCDLREERPPYSSGHPGHPIECNKNNFHHNLAFADQVILYFPYGPIPKPGEHIWE